MLILVLGAISCDDSRKPSNIVESNLKLSQSFVGLDVDGTLRSCIDKFDQLSCTKKFSDSDAFALSCERSGKYAIQCGCHDWICVDSISKEAELSY